MIGAGSCENCHRKISKNYSLQDVLTETESNMKYIFVKCPYPQCGKMTRIYVSGE